MQQTLRSPHAASTMQGRLAPVLRGQLAASRGRLVGLVRSLGSAAQPTSEAPYGSTQHDPQHGGVGQLHLIVGPMFAGKTTRLIQRVRDEEAAGRRVVMVKSAVDTRYAVDHVVTHDGVRVPCVPLSRLGDLRSALGEQAYAATHVVAVDEAQFMGDLRDAVLQATEADGKTVYVAGLSGDFRRDNFGQISQLLPLADNVEKLSGRCTFCEQQGRRRASHFTLRIAASTQQELVGGAESYAPVCREHYVQLSRVREQGAPTGDTTEAEEEQQPLHRTA